ncbi:MAG: LytR/AlgR family response regulator transcription factor [Erysipelotrichaceae bacterium]
MRIALCDDEKACHDTIVKLIKKYQQANPDCFLFLSSFYSGKELLNNVDEYGSFDLYILDCIMPGMDGIELGKALRTRDNQGIIFYLTTSPEFALDSYRVNAFDYLLKPVDERLFFQSLDKAIASLSKTAQEMVQVKTADSIHILPVDSILYAERIRKQIDYYLADGTILSSITFNGSFKDAVKNLLPYNQMLLVGSSFVVNLSHVTQVTKTDLILTGNMHVPIPRRMYDNVKKQWANFWLNGGR